MQQKNRSEQGSILDQAKQVSCLQISKHVQQMYHNPFPNDSSLLLRCSLWTEDLNYYLPAVICPLAWEERSVIIYKQVANHFYMTCSFSK